MALGWVHDSPRVSGYIVNDAGDVVQIKRAFITPAATGNTALVAAVTGKSIRVLSVITVSTLANSIKFQSATTDVTATFPLAANGGFSLNENLGGWFQTASAEALNLNCSVATSTGCMITYIEV